MSAAPLLTIALPTITTRAAQFAKLYAHLHSQVKDWPVEIISACDNKEISIGLKRQQLLERAKGEYIVYIDDDDAISDDYVDSIMWALEERPDCVGFLIRCTQNDKNPVMAKASLKYKKWGENQDGWAHTRSPYQKTPVRREIALKVGFPDLRYGEDRIYSEGLVKLLKTEVFVERVLYHYQYRHEHFATKYGFVNRRAAGSARGVRGKVDYKGRQI